MAYLNILGAETGDLSEAFATTGSAAVDSTFKRTGGYCYACNTAAAGGTIEFRGYGTDGKGANFAVTTTFYWTFYFMCRAFPASIIRIGGAFQSTNQRGVEMFLDGSGNVTIWGTAQSATIATLSTGTYYRFDLRCTIGGTSGLSINGGTEVTVTSDPATQIDKIRIGDSSSTATWDYRFDDMAMSNSAMPGAGEVRMSVPIGAGNYALWSTGTFADVDEVPHDSGTTKIVSGTTAGDRAATYDMQTAATAGITGGIKSVKLHAVLNEVASTTTLGRLRLRSGTTDADSTDVDIGSTTYITLDKLWDTDPADAAAWTTTKYDALEGGVVRSTADTSSIDCTAIYIMAWCNGASPQTVTPGIGTLTLAAQAPTVKVNNIVTPGIGTLVLAAQTPKAIVNFIVVPGIGTLVLSAQIPTVIVNANQVAVPGLATLVLAAQAPTVLTPVLVVPGIAALLTSLKTPQAIVNAPVTPGIATLALSPKTPTVLTPVVVSPGTASLTAARIPPSVLLPVRVSPGVASLILTPRTPIVPVPAVYGPGGHRGSSDVLLRPRGSAVRDILRSGGTIQDLLRRGSSRVRRPGE